MSQTAYVKNSKHACFGTQIGSELPKQNHLGHLKKKKDFWTPTLEDSDLAP